MKTIWKFPLSAAENQTIKIPQGAKLLTVAMQGGEPYVWAQLETTSPAVKRLFHVRGTGHEMNGIDATSYVGTFQMHGGALVWHLFDGGEIETREETK